MESGAMGLSLEHVQCYSAWFLGIVIHQDHYRGHYIEKNNRPCNDAIKYKPLNQDDAL
jgi:hypothetical protein